MKTRMSIIAALAVMAAPALAQDSTTPSTTQPPAEQMAPSSPPAAPAAPAVTEPAPAPVPATPDRQAAAPADAGLVVIADLRESEDDNKMVGPLSATVDQVEDMDVFDANGNKIGEIDSVLEDKDGNIKAVAIEYGGFLGIGSKGAVLTFDRLKTKDGNIVVDLTEDDLAGLPAWND